MDAIQPAPMDVEEKTMASNGGSGAVLEEEKPTPASRVQTRAKTEEIRKNEMNVTERMTTEYALITRAIKNCRDKVKSQTSLRVGGEVTVVNDLFKVAMKEADKAWESVVNAVNTTMEALEGKESSEREMNFLGNVQLNSLEEAETVIRENREQLEQFRELTKEVKEIEGVEDIVGLLEKINGEREAVARERSEWEIVEAELLELKGMAELRENENLTDKWKDVNDELQTLREQFAELKKKMEEGEVDSLLLVDNVESLEGQVARLERENKRMKEINEDTLARLVRAEDANAGQNSSNQNGSVLDQHALSESDRISENMRRQREALQRMRMRQGCEGVSSPPSDSRASPRTRGQHTSTTPIAGAYSLGTIETGNGGMGNVSVGGSGDSNGIMGKSVGLMANALPRMARYSGKKEEWENFETGFMIRFGKMDTVVAMSLLNDHLFGEAKDALRSVPVEEKAKGVKGVLTWLRSRLSNETPFEEIEVSRMLRHQKINGRSVGKVCEELEELTARLHRDEVNKETERKRQLMFLFEGKYKEHVRLLGLFREGASYSAMKAALVELEYMRRTEREFKAYTEGVGSSGPRCFNCGETSHKANQCNSRNGKGGGSGGSGSGANGHSGSMGTSGGANGTYRGGYSGPSRGGYSSGRGGYNNGSGQKPQQNNGYGNGGARAHSVAAPANGYNSGRSYTNVGTGANSVPLGHKSSVNAIKTESFSEDAKTRSFSENTKTNSFSEDAKTKSFSRSGTEVQRHEYPERSVRDLDDFFFIKRRELVKGKVNGVPVQVLLDTGADVSIISADVVDKIDGAVVEKGVSPMIKDASNGVMDIVGRTILEVELEVGNRTQVGFYVLNNGLGKVIIGGKGLDDVGVELKEVRFREKTHSNGDDAIVLRDAQIGPGQLGSIWVKGSEHNTVMLESSVDQVMEGIAVTERIVHIPVFNDTESELQFTKYQPVGVWRVVEGAVEEMHAGQKGKGIVSDNRASEEMIQKKSEIAIGRGDASEMTRMPDSTRKLTMADLEIDKGTLYVLDRDHERLLYVPRSERKGLIKEMHESVLVGHAGGKKMNQMLRKKYVWGAMEKDIAAVLRDCDFRLVNRESPLHWENPCPGCLDKPRPLSALWSSCPSDFASFSFPTLKEYAIIRAIIEKFPNMKPLRIQRLVSMGDLDDNEEIPEKIVEETVSNLCTHALVALKGPTREWRFTVVDIDPRYEKAYRRGLGEEVESSIGYGAVIHQPGVPLTRCGGDRARWEWKREMHTQWNEIFAGWHRLRTKKTIKSLLIFWPRAMQKDDMVSLKDVVVYHTERNAWNVVVVEEPCQGGATDPEYVPFLVDWSVDQPKTGRIRVIVTSNAITDGTPISALERCHSWIRRDHYEFAAQAWIDGKPWDIKKAESELEEKGWRTKETKVVEEVTYRVDTPKLNQVIKDKNRRELEKAECFECGSTEHKAWKCTRKDKNKKAYYGRGRPAAKEGDVMEPTHKKKRY
ncbi:hypothetical protein PRIPAC_78238 [Pristionchus pacificus]|uniref:Uncharacterized protein n=1 Tax=Pristionchus pacificus TaxID=54126 RepID=A0A2A6BVQ7_PRIPA|nr:hypothetical protein PRIPAC_78238 [Pristionchus pacificus]|eukprot:PDM69965.1 hypothetical protein PRIPAC_49177 [Pristionchus pacificus]